MTKLLTTSLVSIAITATSLNVAATEFNSSGARYAGQGGTMVANANDAFALSVNPANLLSHGSEPYFELAFNVKNIKEFSDDSNNPDELNDEVIWDYVGGFKSGETWLIGFFISEPAYPIFVQNSTTNEIEEALASQWSFAFAYGSRREEGDLIDWGIGGSIDMFDTDTENIESLTTSYFYTLSGKVAMSEALVFSEDTFNFSAKAGVSYSNEATTEHKNIVESTIRPETLRAGVTTELMHSLPSFTWGVAVSGEYLKTNESYVHPLNIEAEDELRLGVEVNLIDLIGSSNIAFRGGIRSLDDSEGTKLSSTGLGYTSGHWSFDLAAGQSKTIAKENNIDFSVTYSN